MVCLWESGWGNVTRCRGSEMFGDRIEDGIVSLYQDVEWPPGYPDHTSQEALVGVSYGEILHSLQSTWI